MALTVLCSLAAGVLSADLIAFDTRWEYPHYLTFRPGNGQVCEVNPPRFSWPYVPHVILRQNVPAWTSTLQLALAGEFSAPGLEVADTAPATRDRGARWRTW